MKLKNKCLEDFEKWLKNRFMDSGLIPVNPNCNYLFDIFLNFNLLPESFKYGVYIDFFETKRYNGLPLFSYVFDILYKLRIESQTHNDIVKQSIKKANEIYNYDTSHKINQ